MNEQQLRRLLHRLLTFSAPLPLALLGAACGGSSLLDSSAQGGSGSTAGMAMGGAGGDLTGGGMGGASAGAAATGDGGASAGAAGTGGAGGNAAGGAGGGGASAGGAGGGGPDSCKSQPLSLCGSGNVVVPKTCVDASTASVGAMLPLTTCRDICDAMFLQSCSLTAMDSTSATVLCYSACPAGRRPAGLSESLRGGFS
ncbi:MAG TPA: hypothetical protein VGL19_06400, partial [Polyangiaceae bacterium]